MNDILNLSFLNSIVLINDFSLFKTFSEINLLTIENNIDVSYLLRLDGIVYSVFRQEDPREEFEVIEVVMEKFNNCKYVDFMASDKWNDYWIIRFHSGIHHLIVGFNSAKLVKK